MREKRRRYVLLTLLAVGLASIFTVGCGSSSDDFVAQGRNSNPINAPTAGNLLFRFAQAQQTATVPLSTTTLRFDFFSNGAPSTASFLFTETRSYAEQIIVRDVPPNVRSVAVTAFGPTGEPTAVLTGQVTVVIGADTGVDLAFNSNPTFDSLAVIPSPPSPAVILSPSSNTAQVEVFGTFDSSVLLGQRTSFDVPINSADCSFTFSEATGNSQATASISPSGLVTGLNYGQNSHLNCEYEALGTTRSGTILVRACELVASANGSTTLSANDSYTSGYQVVFHDSDATETVVNSSATFATNPSTVAGVTIDGTTGNITTAGAAAGDFKVQVSWKDPRTPNADGTGGTDTTFTTEVTFTVSPNS